jgi:DNA-binding response OmpR family regulator
VSIIPGLDGAGGVNSASMKDMNMTGQDAGLIRPCFLVVDREYSGSISTRKLVIETAKFNVLTAYSAEEALDIMRRFPSVDGVVLDSDLVGTSCKDFLKTLREIAPSVPVVGVSTPYAGLCEGADYHLESFDPKKLLSLLETLRPEATAAVERRNEALKAKEKAVGE